MWNGWLSFLLGIWLIFSALFETLQIPGNMTIVGLLILIDGFFILRKWEGLLLGIFGLWILLCGILFGLVGTLNFFVVGVLVTLVSFLCIYHRHMRHQLSH